MAEPSSDETELRFPMVAEDDPFWERLGRDEDLGESEQWIRVDGIGTARVYFRRDITDHGPAHITGLCIIGHVTADLLRNIPLVPLENFDADIVAGSKPEDLEPLKRSDYASPREFLEVVAFYYRVFIMQGATPAKAISEHSGVPVATVRSWIHETRTAGMLPPGRKGKAG